MEDSPFRLGDVVRTRYGVGVVVAVTSQGELLHDDGHSIRTHFYQVLLWRMPERSVGSSSVAHLQPDAILGRLPGAPGMVTSLKSGEKVMIYTYYSSTNTFLVKRVYDESSRWSFVPFIEELPDDAEEAKPEEKSTDFLEVTPDQLQLAPSAKFYPLLQELVRRGDAAATATSSFLTSKTVTKIVQKTTDLVESSTEAVLKTDIAVDSLISKDRVEQLTSSVEQSLPTYSEEVKQVVAMLKDEELTVLLKKGHERLKELMSTDISKATENALENIGIRVVAADSGVTDFSASIAESRETALKALETILKEVDMDTVDLESVRLQLEGNFTTMFDSLAQAAKSDRTLNSIFDTIAGKTTEWQEASGRLLSTRSASLFMEGASRIQARAANLFSKDQLDWAGEIGSKLTKAFTEGDAALARLKSIELGEAVRDRLVAAIEIRSESLGGLDGIIAGALTSVRQQGDSAVGQIQTMLTQMQKSATSVTTDARETLISILSHRSEYRDVALLRLEKVLCDLEFQLSDDLSPEDIAAVARGEGGTALIFEPIARRAGKEIEKQLDTAEASITDPTMLDVLKHVRKIVSGELTLSSVMDEVVNILNDDNVVAAGESLVQQGESVLDAIEGVSSNKVVDDVMKIAEKAGITKETVMKQVESLDVNQLLDTAGSAVTDERARRQLISSATDTALDFILRILPSMPVPPLNGVKDGLVYHISNLSMEGFKVRKEDISLVLAGIQATSKKKREPSSTTESSVPSLFESDSVSTFPSIPSTTSFDSQDLVETESYGAVKATELLIIDVQHISAVLDDTVWSFEQTYMPYLKGGGSANVKLSDGAIRLQFELRRRRKPQSDGSDSEWEPVLCLHDRSCSIGEVDLVLQGQGRWTWILNKLASIFKGPLRDYVVRSIVGVLTAQSGWILENLNSTLAPYWDLILRTAGLQLDELVEAGDEVVVAAVKSKDDGLVELVWRERVPLGMNLLLNDESGLLKVVDFPRGSQARSVCTERQIDPDLFKGATIVAVNGFRYDLQDDLFEALRDPGRPKSVQFELANAEDAERIKRFVEGNDAAEEAKAKGVNKAEGIVGTLHTVTFTEPGELGIEFASSSDSFGLVVTGFIKGEAGTILAAERQGQIKVGDLLCQVNGEFVLGENGSGMARAMQLLESIGTTRPLSLSFADSYLYRDVFEKPVDVDVGGPSELKLLERQLANNSRRIKLTGFEDVSGRAELAGVFIGDHLLFINGIPVGGGCRWLGDDHSPNMNEVNAMLTDEKRYPIGLTFGRPKQSKSRWSSSPRHANFDPDNAETICVTANRYDQLGCVLEMQLDWSIVVTNFEAVPGPMQSKILQHVSKEEVDQLAIESVNGQFVPSYATCDIVRNAMKRSWTTHGQVELLLCNDTRRDWVHSLLQQE